MEVVLSSVRLFMQVEHDAEVQLWQLGVICVQG